MTKYYPERHGRTPPKGMLSSSRRVGTYLLKLSESTREVAGLYDACYQYSNGTQFVIQDLADLNLTKRNELTDVVPAIEDQLRTCAQTENSLTKCTNNLNACQSEGDATTAMS